MNKLNPMSNRSGGRPKVKKKKAIKNPDYFAGWEWLWSNKSVKHSEGHKFTKNRNSIFGVLFYCKICEYTWEQDKALSHCRGEGIEYYQDFPTRGLERRKCPQCKAKGGSNGCNIQNTNTKPKN